MKIVVSYTIGDKYTWSQDIDVCLEAPSVDDVRLALLDAYEEFKSLRADYRVVSEEINRIRRNGIAGGDISGLQSEIEKRDAISASVDHDFLDGTLVALGTEFQGFVTVLEDDDHDFDIERDLLVQSLDDWFDMNRMEVRQDHPKPIPNTEPRRFVVTYDDSGEGVTRHIAVDNADSEEAVVRTLTKRDREIREAVSGETIKAFGKSFNGLNVDTADSFTVRSRALWKTLFGHVAELDEEPETSPGMAM